VVLVLEENHGYSSVIGSSSMPYLNQLAKQYGLATQYYADTHPSIGNYFMFTTGQIITNDDGYTSTVNADNLVRHIVSAGKTWKSYAEDLPGVGYTGGDQGAYSEHHNPFSYFSDVRGSSTQKQNLVPFTQFASDLGTGKLPDFSFVIANLNDDAHDGSLGAADSWLQQNIAPVLTSPQFQNGSGLLIIVFDEAEDSDSNHGGGRVAMVVAGPSAKTGFTSSTLYQHENLLKTITTYMGIDGNIGAAGTANPMSEFLK
jgi:phosphatidylinositol-3-phosphatase